MRNIMKVMGLFLFLCTVSWQASAAKVAAVSIPDQVVSPGVEQPLLLNGAGVRKKFFFKIYIGALYLPVRDHSADRIINGDKPNRVLMHFLYDEVSKSKLTDGWLSGFRANLDEGKLEDLGERIQQFTKLFENATEGDQVWIDYLPGTGTRVTINDREKGIVPGADFNQALLRIWLGEEPVTDDLKRAMLGIE